MPLLRPGPLTQAISGSLASTTIAAGKGPQTIRARPRRITRRTQSLLLSRARLARLTRAWHDLTDTQRLTWASAASTYTRLNRLGVAQHVSPLAYFALCNYTLLIHLNTTSAAPIPQPSTPAKYNLTLYASASGDIYIDTDTVPLGTYIALVTASRPMRTIATPHPRPFRLMRTFASLSPIDLDFTDEFDAAFGHPTQGEFIAATCAIGTLAAPPQPAQTLTTFVSA